MWAQMSGREHLNSCQGERKMSGLKSRGIGLAALIAVGGVPQLWAQQDVHVATTAERNSVVGDSARTPTDTMAVLTARVEELDQQVRILNRLHEISTDSAAAAAKDKQSVTANAKDGFGLKSADGKYSLRLRGYVQGDGRFFASDEADPATHNLRPRRVRPILGGYVGRYFGFRLMPDFGGTSPAIFDAYFDGNFTPAFTVRAGKFKPPIGLERLQSAQDIMFAERGLPNNLVPSR